MYYPTIQTPQSLLHGRLMTTSSDVQYFSFQGIPYAKPPLGDLRFKDPQAYDGWSESRYYNTTQERSVCAQSNVLVPEYKGSEDCLYLNIFTPKIPNVFTLVQLLLPVMVWIHGGGYVGGSGNSDLYGPDYIVEKNVILVTMNYRLGVLGFLNLRTPDIPGNAGLKDQVMALRWVQDNIGYFGGNPSDVTVFGESSGGASGQYLMISPMADGLFHKVISQSGSCLSNWIFTPTSVDTLQKAKELVKMTGIKTKDKEEISEILRSLSVEELVTSANKLRSFEDIMRDAAFLFAPSIERVFPNQEAFLSSSPIELFCSGKFRNLPYMSGYNSKEGIYYADYALMHKGHIENLQGNFQFMVPIDMNYSLNSSMSIEISQKIKDFYFRGEELNRDTMEQYIDLYTDYAFLQKMILSAELVKRFSTAPEYFYKFSFDGDLNLYKKRFNLTYKGASHLDDLGYLFGEHKVALKTEDGSKSSKVRKLMVEMWTNFAKYGNPTPGTSDSIPFIWEQIQVDQFNYLDINEKPTMKMFPERRRMKFWKRLYEKYAPSQICLS